MVLCGIGPIYQGNGRATSGRSDEQNSGSDVLSWLHPAREAFEAKCIPPETPAGQQVNPQKDQPRIPRLYVPLPSFWLPVTLPVAAFCCDVSRTVADCRAALKLSRSVARCCDLPPIVSSTKFF